MGSEQMELLESSIPLSITVFQYYKASKKITITLVMVPTLTILANVGFIQLL